MWVPLSTFLEQLCEWAVEICSFNGIVELILLSIGVGLDTVGVDAIELDAGDLDDVDVDDIELDAGEVDGVVVVLLCGCSWACGLGTPPVPLVIWLASSLRMSMKSLMTGDWSSGGSMS